MPDIQIDRRGRIRHGRWAGQTIFVQDNRGSTGGYLILVGSDNEGNQSGDIWVEADKLEGAFHEAGWTVEWEEPLISRREPVVDLDAAASAIEARRAIWSARGLEMGPLTWRDQARGWPFQLVSRDRAAWPDSVGFRVSKDPAMGAVVLFDGGWADVEWLSEMAEPEVSAPDVDSVDKFEALLDSLLERWSPKSDSGRV